MCDLWGPVSRRRPTPFFRLVAWITSVVLLSAAAPLSRDYEAAPSPDASDYTLHAASSQSVDLLATHTFAAKPKPVSWLSRGLDTPFIATALRRLTGYTQGGVSRIPRERDRARYARSSLVGIVEFRI